MRNKKKLLMFLALGSMANVYADGAESVANDKHERLYKNMTKNIENGLSNDNNYKLIEKVLKDRNKELKDLYLQSDYILKPEYLEWQIFMSGFYNNSSRGGTKDTVTNKITPEARSVDMGMIIPVSGITKEELALNITPVSEPNVNIAVKSVYAPQVSAKEVNFSGIELPQAPYVAVPYIYGGNSTVNYSIGSYSPNTAYYTNGNKIFDNLNVDTAGTTLVLDSSTYNIDITGGMSYENGTYSGISSSSYTHTGYSDDFSVHNIGQYGNFEIKGNWDMTAKNNEWQSIGFLTYRPFSINSDSKVTFSGKLDLQLESPYDEEIGIGGWNESLIGMSLNLGASTSGTAKATLENTGIITLKDGGPGAEMLVGMQLDEINSSYARDGELINSGNIIVESVVPDNWGGNTGSAGVLVTAGSLGNSVLVKPGNITVTGSGARAIEVWGTYNNSNIRIDGSGGEIILEGANNTVLYMNRELTSSGLSAMDNISNLNIIINGKGNHAISYGFDSSQEIDLPIHINDTLIQSLKFGEDSQKSAIISGGATSDTEVIFEASLANALGQINAGTQNTVAMATAGMLKNYMPVNIGSGAKAMTGLIASYASVENYGDIVNNSTDIEETEIISYYYDDDGNKIANSRTYRTGGTGLAIVNYSDYDNNYLLNKGNIVMGGNYATALYNVGENFISESDHIIVNGDMGTAVYGGMWSRSYNDYAASQTDIKADMLEVNGSNGVVLNSGNGNINIGSLTSGRAMELTANGKNTFAFFFQKYYTNNWGEAILLPSGKATLTSDVNANIKNGAIGFYYEGTGIDNTADISGFLNDHIDTTGGNLTVDVDSDSFKIAVSNAKMNLSSLTNSAYTSAVDFTGADRSKVFNSKLIIDMDSNLDKNNTTGNKTYSNMEIGKSGIDINSGITVTGTENGQAGIAQSFSYDDTKIESNNFGIIDLSGEEAVGMYNKTGTNKNTGIIKATGISSIGMYAVTGTAENSGEINIGSKGIGIYGETYLDSTENPFGSTSVSVIHSGEIKASAGEKAVGIYVNQNAESGTTGTANMDVSGGKIDVSLSKDGVGIYSNNSGVNGTNSVITVGENGTGVYIKDSSLTLSNLELNLLGDSSVGIFTDGTASFSGSGTVNVDGSDIIVFNIAGSGGMNQNFTINSTPDSKYTVQNMKNSTLYYDSAADMGTGGTFLTGMNSAVFMDVNSSLISSSDNMVGIALKGEYVRGLPVTINSNVQNYEVLNKGYFNFGNESVGIYTVEGASAKNEGIIQVGDNSAGLYGSGTASRTDNSGTIEIGQYSVGIYNRGGTGIQNDGNISSVSERAVGLYMDGFNNTDGLNSGTINLTGDKSIGAYISENGNKTFNNTGNIEIGDSSSETNPGIGIYNNNSNAVMSNSGDIKSGKKSIGIYNEGGQLTHLSGIISTDESGTGIYSSSGSVLINTGQIKVANNDTVGIYGVNGAVIDNNALMTVGSGSYGIILEENSVLTNRNITILEDTGVLVYSDGNTNISNETGADINMTGSNSRGFYMENGGIIYNNADITGDSGTANIGIYNELGSIYNSGNIKVGDSVIIDAENPFLNKYAVGLYGENVQDMKNKGNIEVGANGVGFYVTGNINEAVNTGNITSSSSSAVGIYMEQGSVKNTGNITLSGDNSIGIAAARNSRVSNSRIITMNGNDSMGIYANANSVIVNESSGKIYINGDNSTGVQLSGGSTLENYGLITVAGGTTGSVQVIEGDSAYTAPSIINAGVIKVDEKFELNNFDLIIKPDPTSFRTPTIDEITVNDYELSDINAGFLLSNSVRIAAPSFDFGNNTVKIDPLFTQGTNARVYKFENVFDPSTPGGGINTGEISLESNSLTFNAIPIVNDQGKIDIWMEKTDYNNFTSGAWYDSFAENIEEKYLNAEGEALAIYDRLDLITDEDVLRNTLGDLAGSMYANINQREQDIYGVLNNAMTVLQGSGNNTKENVKINVIAGKGSTKEKTSGVESYDYNSAGVLALREVEKTYRHTFGYSLGYVRTDFQMDDNKNNTDTADTVQLGLHNKYSTNGWTFRNDLLGRASFHTSERNVSWYDNTSSELKADYNVYGISSLNEIGKDFEIGRNIKMTPYAGIELGYMTHGSFSESGGAESLKVESNDGYSIKPGIGMRIEGEKSFGKNSDWKIKGNIGLGYEYELGNMNKEESASLATIENGYHNLASPAEENWKIKTGAGIGVELKDKYGIFVTGEYGTGNDNEDYRIGLNFKASF